MFYVSIANIECYATQTNMIKAIIFDWHGVLDQVVIDGFLEILSKNSRFSIERINQIIVPLEKKMIVGNLSREKYIEELMEEAVMKKSDVEKAFNYVVSVEKNEELWIRLPQLKKNYKIGLVSDAWPEKTSLIKHKFILEHFFDTTLFSSDVKMAKSDKKIYLLACELLNVLPSETLFIDDNENNIRFAKSLGFEVCLFRGNDDLNDILFKT